LNKDAISKIEERLVRRQRQVDHRLGISRCAIDRRNLVGIQGVLDRRGRCRARYGALKQDVVGRRDRIGDQDGFLVGVAGALELPDAPVGLADGLEIQVGPVQGGPLGRLGREIRGIDGEVFEREVLELGVVVEDGGWLQSAGVAV